jgi:hypothetical protein
VGRNAREAAETAGNVIPPSIFTILILYLVELFAGGKS